MLGPCFNAFEGCPGAESMHLKGGLGIPNPVNAVKAGACAIGGAIKSLPCLRGNDHKNPKKQVCPLLHILFPYGILIMYGHEDCKFHTRSSSEFNVFHIFFTRSHPCDRAGFLTFPHAGCRKEGRCGSSQEEYLGGEVLSGGRDPHTYVPW